jgi:hypothetical protein
VKKLIYWCPAICHHLPDSRVGIRVRHKEPGNCFCLSSLAVTMPSLKK